MEKGGVLSALNRLNKAESAIFVLYFGLFALDFYQNFDYVSCHTNTDLVQWVCICYFGNGIIAIIGGKVNTQKYIDIPDLNLRPSVAFKKTVPFVISNQMYVLSKLVGFSFKKTMAKNNTLNLIDNINDLKSQLHAT